MVDNIKRTSTESWFSPGGGAELLTCICGGDVFDIFFPPSQKRVLVSQRKSFCYKMKEAKWFVPLLLTFHSSHFSVKMLKWTFPAGIKMMAQSKSVLLEFKPHRFLRGVGMFFWFNPCFWAENTSSNVWNVKERSCHLGKASNMLVVLLIHHMRSSRAYFITVCVLHLYNHNVCMVCTRGCILLLH